MERALTVEQCRGARAMLGRQTIADFERGARVPIANNLASIRHALEGAGIEFLSENGIRYRARG
jgi:hypothetical protein